MLVLGPTQQLALSLKTGARVEAVGREDRPLGVIAMADKAPFALAPGTDYLKLR
jgi:hypothetical protein